MKPLMVAAAAPADVREDDLVGRAKAGSSEAFAALFSGYRDRIAGYVRTIVADESRAEDLVQEIFISALRSLHTLEEPSAFKAWLYQIAKNTCLDELRRSRRRAEIFVRWDEFTPHGDGLLDPTQSAHGAASRKEVLSHLRQALGGLPQSQHEALVLREVAGLSYDEIGQRMQLSRPAVESMLFRARRGLRGEYSDISTGARCKRMQGVMTEAVGGLRGMRERRALLRHVRDCPACRHQASVLGFSGLALSKEGGSLRRALSRAAALMPLPIFFNRRAEESEGAATNAASFGTQAQGAVTQFTTMGSLGADHAASVIHKAVAVVAAVAVVGGGGVAVKKSGVPLPGLQPTHAKSSAKKSSTDAARPPRADALPARTESKDPPPAKTNAAPLTSASTTPPPAVPVPETEDQDPAPADPAPAATEEAKADPAPAPVADSVVPVATVPVDSGGVPATDAGAQDVTTPPDTGGAEPAPPPAGDPVETPPANSEPEPDPGAGVATGDLQAS